MRYWFNQRSLRTQLTLVAAGITLLIACLVAPAAGFLADLLAPPWLILTILVLTWASTLAVLLPLERRVRTALLRIRRRIARTRPGAYIEPSPRVPSREIAQLLESCDRLQSRTNLRHRKLRRTLRRQKSNLLRNQRLLAFAQTVQSAGAAQQVYAALIRHLEYELQLAGIALLTADESRAVMLEACEPKGWTTPEAVAELDAAACPSFRQTLPREPQADDRGPICPIGQSLSPDSDLDHWCLGVPLSGSRRLLAHLALPAGRRWTSAARHLATRYLHTAAASLLCLELLDEARLQSLTDPLTGLYSRRSMDQLLQREMALAQRHGQAMSVVMLDMDRFKQINDTCGHAAGDHILRALANCIRLTLRRTDLAFRYGGDEFVIALPQTSAAQAEQVVGKVRQAFAAVDFSQAIAHLPERPTLSVGIADRERGPQTLEALLAAADAALYEAKNDTRDCVRVHRPAA